MGEVILETTYQKLEKIQAKAKPMKAALELLPLAEVAKMVTQKDTTEDHRKKYIRNYLARLLQKETWQHTIPTIPTKIKEQLTRTDIATYWKTATPKEKVYLATLWETIPESPIPYLNPQTPPHVLICINNHYGKPTEEQLDAAWQQTVDDYQYRTILWAINPTEKRTEALTAMLVQRLNKGEVRFHEWVPCPLVARLGGKKSKQVQALADDRREYYSRKLCQHAKTKWTDKFSKAFTPCQELAEVQNKILANNHNAKPNRARVKPKKKTAENSFLPTLTGWKKALVQDAQKPTHSAHKLIYETTEQYQPNNNLNLILQALPHTPRESEYLTIINLVRKYAQSEVLKQEAYAQAYANDRFRQHLNPTEVKLALHPDNDIVIEKITHFYEALQAQLELPTNAYELLMQNQLLSRDEILSCLDKLEE